MKNKSFSWCILILFLFSQTLFSFDFGIKTNLTPTSQNQSDFIMGMVTASALNVRMSPWGRILTVIYRGDIVKVMGTSPDNRWYKIEFSENGVNHAYVYKKYISFTPISSSNSSASSTSVNRPSNNTSQVQQGYVTASTLNVRLRPWGTIIGKLPFESKVTIIGREGDWYKISYRGATAFVHSHYIRLGSPSTPTPASNVAGNEELGKKLVDIARSYIGSTQFRGPEVAYGRLACAQFVSTVLHDAGVMPVVLNVRSLVRILKSKGWVEVSPPPWKDGDVITWKTYDYTGDGIKDPDTHVGIVDVKPNGVFAINNSSSRRYPRETGINYAPISRVLRPPANV